MLPEIQNLMQVQEADREISRLKDEIAALPKRVAAIEQKLAGTKAVLDSAKTAVKADEAARRKYETAIADLQQKISKYRDQSLAVKTNEQYKALLQEIQFAEHEIRGNEDKILELMVNAENREKQVKAAEAELKEETAEIEREKAEAHERTARDEKELAEWNAKREQARSAVDPDLLRHYDRVLKFRGSGLAEALAQKCMGCQVMLRPQTYNEIKGGQLIVCDSCQRILYFDPAHDVPVPVADAPHRRRRVRPKADSPQAWFYRSDYPEHGEVLLGFFNDNDSGTATRRIYDFNTGREIGDIVNREGDYHLGFPEDLAGAIRLNGSWGAKEIETWGAEMPSVALDSLHVDLQAAISHEKEHARHGEPVSSEHPAAS